MERKNDFKIIGKGQEDPNVRRRRNAINKFLNSYFKFIVLFFIVAFLWASFSYVIGPKFEEASGASNTIVEEKKIEFLKQYNELQNYKNAISSFSSIDRRNVYRIEKMVPKAYSRDDLFTEITYFLLQNNFRINSINIIDPGANSAITDTGAGRRPVVDASTQQSSDMAYRQYTDSLSSDIGAWVINLELSDMDYPRLKTLLSLLENNLKLMDVYSLNFYPSSRMLNIGILTYYKK